MPRPPLKRPAYVAWRRWPGDPSGRTALVRPAERSDQHLADLSRQGFRVARTGALSRGEADPLLRRGWSVAAKLHLLHHDLGKVPRAALTGDFRFRRATDRDVEAVSPLDDHAFPPEWRLGSAGLTEALGATPWSRFRIARTSQGPVGYAICGRSGRDGYIQRLAVAESHRGAGLGRALTIDGLRWLKRWRATSASVNTYVGNEVALHLYLSLGFDEVHPGLMVLTIDL